MNISFACQISIKNAGRPAEDCLYSAHVVQLEILGQQQAQVCFGLGHKAAGLVEDGLLHFVAGQPPVACVPRAGELHGVEIGQQICVAALVQRIPLAARLQLCNGQQLFAGIIGEFNDVWKTAFQAAVGRCCFSKRMRKVFRKNEKSMLQNCNKKAKRKGRLQRVKKPM